MRFAAGRRAARNIFREDSLPADRTVQRIHVPSLQRNSTGPRLKVVAQPTKFFGSLRERTCADPFLAQ